MSLRTSPAMVMAQLRTLSRDLRGALQSSMGPDQQAYAALAVDGAVRPWTEEAANAWQGAKGRDRWRRHHLAILCHARAYDLELAGADEAFAYWAKALEHWNAVLADDGFWAAKAADLAERMGTEIDPGMIETVRASLPSQLLEPHVDLAVAFHRSNPGRARRHVEVIKGSGFAPSLIEEVRAEMVRSPTDTAPVSVSTGAFEEILAELDSWLAIDPDNATVVQTVLFVQRKRSERVATEPGGLSRVAEQLEAAEQVLRPVLDTMPPPSGRLAQELARYEYWRGASTWRRASDRYGDKGGESLRSVTQDCARAIALLQLARVLDTTLTLDAVYKRVDHFESLAEELWGMWLLASRPSGPPVDHIGAAQHLRSAIRLRPTNFQAHCFLVQALLGMNPCPIAEVEQVLAKAQPLAETEDERQTHLRLRVFLLGIH